MKRRTNWSGSLGLVPGAVWKSSGVLVGMSGTLAGAVWTNKRWAEEEIRGQWLELCGQ